GMGDGVIAAHGQRDDSRRDEPLVEAVNILVRGFETVAAAKRHIANICHAQGHHGRALQNMVVRTDSLSFAYCAWTEAGPASVGNTEVHRNPDQRHLQVAEVVALRGSRL